MNNIQNKIEIIRKLIDKIESENDMTELLQGISSNSRKDFKDYSPEQVCFDVIKQIVDSEELPENIQSINIYMAPNNQILRYELVSSPYKVLSDTDYINIIWDD